MRSKAGRKDGLIERPLPDSYAAFELRGAGFPALVVPPIRRKYFDEVCNAQKKLAWCTERIGRVIDFWVAFSDVVIIVRRLVREGWRRYRWEERPSRTTTTY